MNLDVPYSLPPQKQPAKNQISEDEFEAVLSVLKDKDLGVIGGSIDETAEFERAKSRAKKKQIIENDKELTVFDEARDRVLNGNNNYAVKVYTLKKGEDLRAAAYNVYGNANAWVLLAAANDIVNPSSKKEVYEGRTLMVI